MVMSGGRTFAVHFRADFQQLVADALLGFVGGVGLAVDGIDAFLNSFQDALAIITIQSGVSVLHRENGGRVFLKKIRMSLSRRNGSGARAAAWPRGPALS